MNLSVEFDYGPITTRLRAAPEILAWVADLLTVPNPEGWPQTISFWNGLDQTFLSGHLHHLETHLTQAGVPFYVHNRPQPFVNENPDPRIIATSAQPDFTLHRYQCSTVRKMLAGVRGGVQLATGSGKTACLLSSLRWLELLLCRPVNSLSVMPTTNLAKQMVIRMQDAGLNAQIFKSGKWGGADHVVSVINGLSKHQQSKNPAVLRLLNSRDVLCFDEGHHTQADMYYNLALQCPAHFRWNLSATLYANRANPYMHPGDMRIMGITGPTLAMIPARFLWEHGFVPQPEITFIPVDYPDAGRTYGFHAGGRWNDTAVWRGTGKDAAKIGVEWDLIVNSSWRNEIIRRMTYWSLVNEADSKVVILVQRLDHGEILQRMLYKAGVYSFCAYGGSKVITIDRYGKSRKWWDKNDTMLSAFEDGSQRVIIGSQKFDEGQTFPVFTDLILAQAGKGGEANRRVYQRVGRAMHSGVKVRVRDLYDRTHRMVKQQAETRLMALHNEGYQPKVALPADVLQPIPGVS